MLLADENVPGRAIAQLRAKGFDVVSVQETLPGLKDSDVLAWAVREARILISFDRDYGELIFRRGLKPPRSLIYFRLRPSSPEQVVDLVLRFLSGEAGPIEGRMLIVSRQGIRERLFPDDSL